MSAAASGCPGIALSLRALLVLAFLGACALPAAAQTAAPTGKTTATAATAATAASADDEVLLSAGTLERRGEERVVVAEGGVVVRHKDMRLAADRALYNEVTKDLIADGNVVFDSGADRLQGEHLELNLDTRVGFVEQAQGFIQTYYLTGERIEKQGLDRYFVRRGTFTTCEGALPDWSFHTTSADVTVDEYLHAWNPSLHVQRVPVFYLPYAVFPVKRDRATGLLIPEINYSGRDGWVVRNAFYWAPRDNFDATIGLDYLQNAGWGVNGEMRYLLAPRTLGTLNAYYLRQEGGTGGPSERFAFATRNSHELPYEMHLEAEAFLQSDRQFIGTYGQTIERRSSERTTASVYINRSWSSWDFTLSGRHEESLLTAQRNTVTRFPELTVDHPSTRIGGSELLLRLNASGARLSQDNASQEISTTRFDVAPELTLPLSLGGIARVLPTVTYDLTYYSENLEGSSETRQVPTYQLGLEGPRLYRVWEFAGGAVEKLKHLVEPSVAYVYTPDVDQDQLPQFDSLDRIEPANQLQYSLTNTIYAKVAKARATPAPAGTGERAEAPAEPQPTLSPVAGTTREMLWVKLSQIYSFEDQGASGDGRPFSPVDWEARTAPHAGLELTWRGNFDVYGGTVGYQDVTLQWKPAAAVAVHAEWRTVRDSPQDFLDVGGEFTLGKFGFEGRSRYNLSEDTFVENRFSVKYTSQCWDVTVGYVHWTDTYSYSLLISLKGIGTVLKV